MLASSCSLSRAPAGYALIISISMNKACGNGMRSRLLWQEVTALALRRQAAWPHARPAARWCLQDLTLRGKVDPAAVPLIARRLPRLRRLDIWQTTG